MSEPKLALINSATENEIYSCIKILRSAGQCCVLPTYRIDTAIARPWGVQTLLDQLKNEGFFNEYIYVSKKQGGSGRVKFRRRVRDLWVSKTKIPSPFPSITYYEEISESNSPYMFDEINVLSNPLELVDFTGYKGLYKDEDSGKRGSRLNGAYLFVEDPNPDMIPYPDD